MLGNFRFGGTSSFQLFLFVGFRIEQTEQVKEAAHLKGLDKVTGVVVRLKLAIPVHNDEGTHRKDRHGNELKELGLCYIPFPRAWKFQQR